MSKNDLAVTFNRFSKMIRDVRDELDTTEGTEWVDGRVRAMLNTKLQEAQLIAMILFKGDGHEDDEKRHELSQEPIISIPDSCRAIGVTCPSCKKDNHISVGFIEDGVKRVKGYLCWDCGNEFTN